MKTITKLIIGLAFVALLGLLGTQDIIISDLNAHENGKPDKPDKPDKPGNDYSNLPSEVTGEMSSNQTVFQPGVAPSIGFIINRPLGKTNNGHGNNSDGVDSSNPGKGGGGPNGVVDSSSGVDGEIKGGDPNTNLALSPNMIRQIDLDTGIVMDIFSNYDFGSFVAGMPITGPLGAMFELWVDINGTMTHIDTIFVGPYMPSASFLVTSQDPWQQILVDPSNGVLIPRQVFRTRADIAFTVQATVSGLSADPSLPLAATAVSLEINGANGDLFTYLLGPEYAISNVNLTAGSPSYTWSGLSQLTPFADPAYEVGQQHISMRTYADAATPSWQVGRATVIIWPMASGFFEQVDAAFQLEPFAPDQTFYGELRDIIINYKDLYPESTTFVQMYKGPQVTGTVGVPISVTVLDLAGSGYDVPQNTTVPGGFKIRSVDMEEVILVNGNGLYTLEMVTGNLPWINGGAYETVEYINFTVDRSVSIRAQIGTK